MENQTQLLSLGFIYNVLPESGRNITERITADLVSSVVKFPDEAIQEIITTLNQTILVPRRMSLQNSWKKIKTDHKG